jgi:predicted alpha/beta-hydrolase family hydrolase
MRNTLAAAAVLVAGLAGLSAFAKDDAAPSDVQIPTARGVKLHAFLHRPKAPNGAAVVLAPGRGFPAKSPLLPVCAERLADAGFAVVRFDYAYYAAKDGAPSPDLSAETADMEAAIGYAKKLDGVSKVILAGKSLGSVIALEWANAHPNDLAGLALLTWVVDDPKAPAEALPQAASLKDCPYPALVLDGTDDSMASPSVLYDVASKCKHPPQIVMVAGDHGFGSPSQDDAETAENVDVAARSFVLWAKRRAAAK